MVRLAALALIVLAFARPLISHEAAAPIGAGSREVVVLLDNSYSMGFGDHWQRATAAAREQFAKLSASDRATLVLFSSGADIQMRSTSDKTRFNAVLDTVKPRDAATRYSPALKVAGSIVAESTLPRREVVIISDFQRGGWRGEEGARLPQGVTLTPIAVQGAADRANLSVTGLSMARSTFSNQERLTVTAVVTNRTERSVSGSNIALETGGLPVANKPLNVEPGGSASVTFDPVTISSKNFKGTVRLADDALNADNSFNFVVSPSEPVRLTIVDRGNTDLYLSRALSIGEAPKFESVSRQADALSDEDLRRSAVVVLNDVDVSTGLARRLTKFVEQGGGLFVATGPRATWPQDVDLLPATIGNPVDRTRGDAGRIGSLEYGHPVFAPFRAPRSGDFSSVPVYGYRNLTAAKNAQVLARFDAGAPAVAERRVGNGRVLIWGSTLDVTWSDLPQRSVFLPFIHRAVRHLAGYTEPQPWVTVGQVLDASVAPRGASAQRVVLTPSGRRLPIEDEGSDVVELSEKGFYELRGDNNQAMTVVAVNVDPVEADLTPIDPKEIVAAAMGGSTEGEGAQPNGIPLTPEAKEKNQRLWWYLLIAGILLLGVDTLVSNRMAKT
jgi:hypothetical protein